MCGARCSGVWCTVLRGPASWLPKYRRSPSGDCDVLKRLGPVLCPASKAQGGALRLPGFQGFPKGYCDNLSHAASAPQHARRSALAGLQMK